MAPEVLADIANGLAAAGTLMLDGVIYVAGGRNWGRMTLPLYLDTKYLGLMVLTMKWLMENLRSLVIILVTAMYAYVGIALVLLTRRAVPGLHLAFLAVLMVVLPLVAIIMLRDSPLWSLAILVTIGFVGLTLIFSDLYWDYGQHGNFNIQLSRLDSIYFTLGTLSTAGTGNIFATSETARAIQSLQMGVDFGYVLLAIGIFVSRLSSSAEPKPRSDK